MLGGQFIVEIAHVYDMALSKWALKLLSLILPLPLHWRSLACALKMDGFTPN